MRAKDVREFAGIGMVAVALGVIGWLALTGEPDARTAMVAVLSAGTGWAFRGKVEQT